MTACIKTVSFKGIETLLHEVYVQVSAGFSPFRIVGLSEEAGKESWVRICAAFQSMGLSFPRDHVSITLAPIGMQKEGDHYDLPIALGILGAWGILPLDELADYCAIGKLDLKGNLNFVAGILPAALEAYSQGWGLICPEVSGSEAAWTGEDFKVLAPNSLLTLINHFKGTQVLRSPDAKLLPKRTPSLDLKDIRGHETLKRVLEISLAGGHNLWIKGLPCTECLQVAACIEGLLPPLSPAEALDVNVIYSVAGLLKDGGLSSTRPFRYLKGGTSFAFHENEEVSGLLQEIFCAHHGVLFLDEMSKFSDSFFEAVHHSLEVGKIRYAETVYPAQIQLICLSDDPSEIVKAYLSDYMDLSLEVSNISSQRFLEMKKEESSEFIRRRIIKAQEAQQYRYEKYSSLYHIKKNAGLRGGEVEACGVSLEAQKLLKKSEEKFKLSKSSFHKVLRVARTIADLETSLDIQKHHVGEALNYRPLIF